MATPDPQKFADDWVRAWIAHDVEAALEHFHDDVVFTSPVTARVLPDTGGVVRGAGQRGADLRRRAGARGPRHLSGVTQYAEIDVLQRTPRSFPAKRRFGRQRESRVGLSGPNCDIWARYQHWGRGRTRRWRVRRTYRCRSTSAVAMPWAASTPVSPASGWSRVPVLRRRCTQPRLAHTSSTRGTRPDAGSSEQAFRRTTLRVTLARQPFAFPVCSSRHTGYPLDGSSHTRAFSDPTSTHRRPPA